MASSIGGCSSETPSTPTKDAGRNTSASSGSTGDDDDTNTSSSSSSSSSSSGSVDAGNDAAPASVSNPKKLTCGAAECDQTKPEEALCCWENSDVTKAKCDDICEAAVGLEFSCDEKADCEGTAACCLTFNGSSCTDDGCTEGPPLCKLDAECTVAGEKCNLIDCKRGDKTIKIRTCTNGLAIPDGCDG